MRLIIGCILISMPVLIAIGYAVKIIFEDSWKEGGLMVLATASVLIGTLLVFGGVQ